MSPIEILEKKLLGTFISGFSTGDIWELRFGGYCLFAQNVISTDEGFLNKWIYENYEVSRTCVDKEDIGKCAFVAARMRRNVTGLKLDGLYNLTIEFENGSELLIPTNVAIVDWQWCLNKSGSDPYMDHLVACFFKGEIQINEGEDASDIG